MRIYFDGLPIDENYYAGLSRSSKLFSKNLKLGSTLCETFELEIDNNGYERIPTIITIAENGEIVKTLSVDKYTINDFTTTFDLTDYMIKFNFGYDASKVMTETKTVNDEEVKYTTLINIFNDICLEAGVETDITDFYGSDMEVSWYDNTYTARNYLSFIAEMNGWNLYITPDNKLSYKELNIDPVITIPFDEISSYDIGEKHTITRVVWDDSENFWEFGNDEGETYYIDTANVFMINETYVEYLYNKISGFTYYDFETKDCPLDFNTGDIIEFTDGVNNYKTIAQIEKSTYSGGSWFGGMKLNVESKNQQITEIQSNDEKIRAIKVILDRESNSITKIVQNVSNMASEISILKQTSGSVSTEIAQAIQKNTDEILSEINKTISTQTSTEIETWFTKTGIQGDLDQLRNDIANNSDSLEKISAYIKQSTYVDEDGNLIPYIELGSDDYQTKIRILPTKIQFLTNEEETAYISNNNLYINESTILKRQQIGHWLTVEDSYGNLNTTWVDEISS